MSPSEKDVDELTLDIFKRQLVDLETQHIRATHPSERRRIEAEIDKVSKEMVKFLKDKERLNEEVKKWEESLKQGFLEVVTMSEEELGKYLDELEELEKQ